MVINHFLTAKDKEAIWRVEDNPNEIKVFDLTDVSILQRSFHVDIPKRKYQN